MSVNVNAINQNNQYQQQSVKIERQFSNISAPYNLIATGEAGLAIPIHWDFLVPGQYYNLQHSIGIQFQPLVSQLYHEFDCELHSYFVPFRNLDENWEEYITGGKDGLTQKDCSRSKLKSLLLNYSQSYTVPNPLLGTLIDYFGVPFPENFHQNNLDSFIDLEFIDYPIKAYNQIYNDILRYPDFEDERSLVDIGLFKVHWNNDYFTRSRAFQQRGVTPLVPIDDTVLMHEFSSEASGPNAGETYNSAVTNSSLSASDGSNSMVLHSVGQSPNDNGYLYLSLRNHDLSGLSFNLNDFWLSCSLQRYNINNARMQPRYVDQLYYRFGVEKQDVRLDLPEFIGSHSFKITQDGVVQTSEGSNTPLGTIVGQAYGQNVTPNWTYDCKEHGVILTLMSVRPKASYYQGLSRKLTLGTRFDWPTPELANAPDVEILRKEVYYDFNPLFGADNNDKPFGWADIYSEWRTNLNRVCGRIRPNLGADSLPSYTLVRDFGNSPALNASFLQCNPDVARIKTYQDEPLFTFFVNNDVKFTIPLPLRSEPALLPTM